MNNMKQMILIFLGGGFGACLRSLTTLLCVKMVGTTFPIGTLIVNILGCFLMGIMIAILKNQTHSGLFHSFLIIGLLGGFTTFSSFSHDCILLFQRGDIFLGMLYLIASITLSLVFLLLGLWTVKMYLQ